MEISSLPYLPLHSIFVTVTSLFVVVYSQCLNDQKALLLQLKRELIFDSTYSTKLVHWNQTPSNDDCCSWGGVECDGSGHVAALRLQNESISGDISNSSSLFSLSYLEVLDLSFNLLSGNHPHSFLQHQTLTYLSLSHNLFNGTFELNKLQTLPHLIHLHLSHIKLSVEVTDTDDSPSSYIFPSLYTLSLASCNLSTFPNFVKHANLLGSLDLSDNRITGAIPSWIWGIQLVKLNLSHNLFVQLQEPYSLPYDLDTLDLHSNQLTGVLPTFPLMATYIDCSDNSFNSTISQESLGIHLLFLSLANNNITRELPASLCDAYKLAVLDLSFNNLRGHIPLCVFQNLMDLEVLNVRGNGISGTIPDGLHSSLRTLDLSNNNLVGKIPNSIENCRVLAVFNVGYNNFDDSFPCLLPSSLRVLVLRSNGFHGEPRCDERSWPDLQIIDIANNSFNGTLHTLNFSTWKGMISENGERLRPNRSQGSFLSDPNFYYRDEVALTVKGVKVTLVKIWPDFTSIDLSSNNFTGDIPDALGGLNSLYLLNLSHNALTGTIPRSLVALTELESLDMSVNQLGGSIPEGLARLQFLSFLNLSNNELMEGIPNGPQFQTFSADSFRGNEMLCGFQLNISCGGRIGKNDSDVKHDGHDDDEEGEEIQWEYVFAALGFVVGLGGLFWSLLCCTSFRERYFDKVEAVVGAMFDGRNRRRRRRRMRARRVARDRVVRARDMRDN